MQIQTLEELKRENVDITEEPTEESVSNVEEPEIEAVETEAEEPEQVAEPATDSEAEGSIETWMQEEEQASEAEKEFSGHDIAAAKRKLKAKLEKRHESEVEALRAEIEKLKANPAPTQEVQALPKLEDFDYDQERHAQAVAEYYAHQFDNKVQSVAETQAKQRAQEQALQQLKDSVDQHFERAAKLVQDNGINPEVYQSADLAVRQSVETIMPGKGEQVVDALIANLGDGSEKTMYFLGRNAGKLQQFQNLLAQDPSGIKAAIFLGNVHAEVTLPKKISSKAPPPAKQINGDASRVSESAMLKKYKAAKTAQDAYNIKKQAKAAGLDTSNWINS